MNLIKKMGYNGFLDMVYEFKYNIKNNNLEFEKTSVVNYFLELESSFDYEKSKQFLEILSKNKEKIIYVIGAGFSLFIAQYIKQKLLNLGYIAIFSDSYEQFDNPNNHSYLVIAVSKSGETDHIINLVNKSIKSNLFIVSFTNQSANRLSNLSNINFKILDTKKLDERNRETNLFFAGVIAYFEHILSDSIVKIQIEES